jgi:hypothetical protein
VEKRLGFFILEAGGGFLIQDANNPTKSVYIKADGQKISVGLDLNLYWKAQSRPNQHGYLLSSRHEIFDTFLSEDGSLTQEPAPLTFSPDGEHVITQTPRDQLLTLNLKTLQSRRWREGYLITVAEQSSSSRFNGIYYQKIVAGTPQPPVLLVRRDGPDLRFNYELSPDECSMAIEKIPSNPLNILTSTPTIHYVSLCKNLD